MLSLYGLPDSKVNRQVAQHQPTAIELDIASGNFDSTLKKREFDNTPASLPPHWRSAMSNAQDL